VKLKFNLPITAVNFIVWAANSISSQCAAVPMASAMHHAEYIAITWVSSTWRALYCWERIVICDFLGRNCGWSELDTM